jgi:L,D-transpeptidase catalytic domain/Putative peptidoglycan binding domain
MLSRRLLLPAVLALALLFPTLAEAATQVRPDATVRMRIEGLRDGKARILSHVRVVGRVAPFVPGQEVELTFFRNGRELRTRVLALSRGGGNYGAFSTRFYLRRAARYAVQARHVATRRLGGGASLRKSWGVFFPSLGHGECGRVVRGFNRHLDRLGYVPSEGKCFGDRTARAVLAYRKVNGFERNHHAGKRIVARVYRNKGRYRLRHPGAGKHAEVSLERQVLVLARRGKAVEVYPVSTGKPSTPTVEGHFQFYLRQPGYNSHAMYYSFYFHGGYAIHGYADVPATYPASHGCVRVPIPDAHHIYNWLDYGDDIFIY